MNTTELEIIAETLNHEIEATNVLLRGKDYKPEDRAKEEGYVSGLRFSLRQVKNSITDMEMVSDEYPYTIEEFDSFDFEYETDEDLKEY